MEKEIEMSMMPVQGSPGNPAASSDGREDMKREPEMLEKEAVHLVQPISDPEEAWKDDDRFWPANPGIGNRIQLMNRGNADYFYKEGINTLRTNIMFSGNHKQVILFTSTVPDEGKSETSFAAAKAFADINKRVLFIDADIRKSVFAKRQGIRGTKYGLSQYLSGQRKLEEVVYRTDIENLDVIMAGPYSPNPAELLEETEFADLLKRARTYYDYILIDSPPMGNLIDGAIIASHSDGAVLVIRSGESSYRMVQKVRDQLIRSDCSILGVALNRVDIKKNGKYYKYYKYGEYGKGGGHAAKR